MAWRGVAWRGEAGRGGVSRWGGAGSDMRERAEHTLGRQGRQGGEGRSDLTMLKILPYIRSRYALQSAIAGGASAASWCVGGQI